MIAPAAGELFAQITPADTLANLLVRAESTALEITLITAVIVPGSGPAVLELYHNKDGTAFGSGNLVDVENLTEGGQNVLFQSRHIGSGIMLKPGATLGAKVSVASGVVISVYGLSAPVAGLSAFGDRGSG